MKRLHRITEAEAIAEFLKAEFYHPEYDRDREQFEHLVRSPDLADPQENALRRALLFRRRGHMWRELPSDTEWWEIELEAGDLDRIRVFPRAQWRRVSGGSFDLRHIVERVRSHRFGGKLDGFAERIHRLSQELRNSEQRHSAVLLIGIHEKEPLTILEGNHRLTAALMSAPDLACKRFRVLAGLSPRMTESCWYITNLPNLWRYARNRLRNLRDVEADISRLMQSWPAHKVGQSVSRAGFQRSSPGDMS